MDWREAARAEYQDRRRSLLIERGSVRAEAQRLINRLDEIDQLVADLDVGAQAFGLAPEPESDAAPATNPPKRDAAPQYKDIVLDVLREAYPASMKAAAVQKIAEERLGREVHWKTTGMTLYRLKKDGLARRLKQDWFFVPEEHRGAAIYDPDDGKPDEGGLFE